MTIVMIVTTVFIVYLFVYLYVRTHGARYLHWFPVFSNMFFAIPAVMAYVYEMYDYSFLSLFMMGASVAYHVALAQQPQKRTWENWVESFSEITKKLMIVDFAFAITYFAVTFNTMIDNWHVFYSHAALGVFVLSVIFYFVKWKTKYDIFHSFWHVGVSLSAALVLLSTVL